MATFVNEDDLPQSRRKGNDTRVIVARGGKYPPLLSPSGRLYGGIYLTV